MGCSTQGNSCQPSIDGKPPISCCGELACKQIIGGKRCEWPATCAAPGETCYDSVDGKPPLTCCGGYECQQIPGGKRCASNRETTTALPSFEDVTTTAGDAPTSSLFQGLSSGPSYYCGGTWNQNNNRGSNYDGPIEVQNPEFCKARCQASGECRGWTVTNDG